MLHINLSFSVKLFLLIINARKVHEQNSYFLIACNISIKLLLLHFGKRVIYVLCFITLSRNNSSGKVNHPFMLLVNKSLLILANWHSVTVTILHESELRGSLL